MQRGPQLIPRCLQRGVTDQFATHEWYTKDGSRYLGSGGYFGRVHHGLPARAISSLIKSGGLSHLVQILHSTSAICMPVSDYCAQPDSIVAFAWMRVTIGRRSGALRRWKWVKRVSKPDDFSDAEEQTSSDYYWTSLLHQHDRALLVVLWRFTGWIMFHQSFGTIVWDGQYAQNIIAGMAYSPASEQLNSCFSALESSACLNGWGHPPGKVDLCCSCEVKSGSDLSRITAHFDRQMTVCQFALFGHNQYAPSPIIQSRIDSSFQQRQCI